MERGEGSIERLRLGDRSRTLAPCDEFLGVGVTEPRYVILVEDLGNKVGKLGRNERLEVVRGHEETSVHCVDLFRGGG